LRVVLDTCILKLATFPARDNASALVFELARSGLIEAWASPAILEEYADVLGDQPEFVAEIVESCRVCHPLTELRIIRHEPDNRFLECAFAVNRGLHHNSEYFSRSFRSETIPDCARRHAWRILESATCRAVSSEAYRRLSWIFGTLGSRSQRYARKDGAMVEASYDLHTPSDPAREMGVGREDSPPYRAAACLI
jgi:hypothetical protein